MFTQVRSCRDQQKPKRNTRPCITTTAGQRMQLCMGSICKVVRYRARASRGECMQCTLRLTQASDIHAWMCTQVYVSLHSYMQPFLGAHKRFVPSHNGHVTVCMGVRAAPITPCMLLCNECSQWKHRALQALSSHQMHV